MASIGRKSVGAATNLAKLLPTGTVLSFQALLPSFSNNGNCLPANKYLTATTIVIFASVCFFSSLTDSFIGDDKKLYFGIATVRGLKIFNKDDKKGSQDIEEGEKKENSGKENTYKGVDLGKYKITMKDWVHAFSALLVFLVFGINSSDVQRCFFPHWGANGNQLMVNLPIGVSALASAVFMIFPTKRRGIGSVEKPEACFKCDAEKKKNTGNSTNNPHNNG